MDGFKIIDGIKRIAINDDPNRVIEFNPNDPLFAARFFQLYREFDEKRLELEAQAAALDAGRNIVDANGIPTNIEAGIKFMVDTANFMRDRIDHVFGEGASQKAFGESRDIEMIVQFFEGMTPFVQDARNAKMAKYGRKSSGKVMK